MSKGGISSQKITDDQTAQEQLSARMAGIQEKQREEAVRRSAAQIGVEYINLKGFPVSPDALRLLPRERAEPLGLIPFLQIGEEIRLAATDPTREDVRDAAFQIGEREHAHAVVYLTSQQSFQQGLKLYDTLPKIRAARAGVEISVEQIAAFRTSIRKPQDVQPLIENTNTTDLVALLLAASLQIGSSDVHIEAEEAQVVVRYRIDGVLQTIATIAKDRWTQLINRIKLIAGLKLNITNAPQDGRYTIHVDAMDVDVRTSTLPTAFGESVVMRLLVPTTIALEFSQLGFRAAALARLEKELGKPNGMIVTTGPTGSGKTTTLYAMLRRLNTPEVKIITLEDPIEYKLEGINQSQIDHTRDYSFSKGLRSILRQDPDIVMVGEIRDKETADTAVQAALTGHLLFSTIHTNDAAGAIPRFLSMGVEPALLAPALRVIMGQRLLRRLCEACREPATLTQEEAARVQTILADIPENSGEAPDSSAATWFRAKGCDACAGSGYKGRVGIYEVLVVDAAVENRVRQGGVADQDMREIAAAQGMITMVQDGVLKAMEGLTALEEVFRVASE